MSLTLKNRVYETTITTSTGSYLLAGVVNASCRPFADAGNGGVIPYIVEQGTKSEWGIGTYDSGTNTLARTTILGNYPRHHRSNQLGGGHEKHLLAGVGGVVRGDDVQQFVRRVGN